MMQAPILRRKTSTYRRLILTMVAILTHASDFPSLRAEAPSSEAEIAIRLNTVGYLPMARKVATITVPCHEFIVERLDNKEIVLRGQVDELKQGIGDDVKYWLADFSRLKKEGTYRLVVPKVSQSAPFSISKGIYNKPFFTVTKAMYLWRCGTNVSTNYLGHHYQHQACHLEDGRVDFIGEKAGEIKDAVGGWHDAGDYNKYTVNGAFTVGMMLQAWLHQKDHLESLDLQIPDSNPSVPDFLEEVKWEVDWLLKMQADDGRVYHKLSTQQFGGFMLPEDEDKSRYFCPWGSAATADFAAAMAMASRAFRPYDTDYADRCLKAARLSYAFLEAHPEDHHPDQSEFNTGLYDSSDEDERIWAAAELWEATGEAKYLQDFEDRVNAAYHRESLSSSIVKTAWDWANLHNLGVFTYLLSKRPGRDPSLFQQIEDDLLASADGIVGASRRHPYGRPLGHRYSWGCNGKVARQAMNLQTAYLLTGDRKYRATIQNGLSYLFGRNPYGRSFITGVGERPPQFPHDRRVGGDGVSSPWPGNLIGGPWPVPTSWKDEQTDFNTNEIAINWNGALIYALSCFVEPATFDEDTARLDIPRDK